MELCGFPRLFGNSSLGTWEGKVMLKINCEELMVMLKEGNVNSSDEIYTHSSEIT